MPACLHCGLSGRHFDGCPLSVTDTLEADVTGALTLRRTVNDDAPICGPERLGDSLDRIAQQVAERTREF